MPASRPDGSNPASSPSRGISPQRVPKGSLAPVID
jgi:hypothetical protein